MRRSRRSSRRNTEGIGRALTTAFAARGLNVVVNGQHDQEVKETAAADDRAALRRPDREHPGRRQRRTDSEVPDCLLVDKDRSIKDGAAKLDTALTTAGVVHDVRSYPDASHGFMSKHKQGEVPRILCTGEKLFGMGFNESATTDVRARIVAFFDEHLAAQFAQD